MTKGKTEHVRIYTRTEALTAAVDELGWCLESLEGDPEKVAAIREGVVHYATRERLVSFSCTSGQSSMTMRAKPILELRVLISVLGNGDLNLCLQYLQFLGHADPLIDVDSGNHPETEGDWVAGDA